MKGISTATKNSTFYNYRKKILIWYFDKLFRFTFERIILLILDFPFNCQKMWTAFHVQNIKIASFIACMLFWFVWAKIFTIKFIRSLALLSLDSWIRWKINRMMWDSLARFFDVLRFYCGVIGLQRYPKRNKKSFPQLFTFLYWVFVRLWYQYEVPCRF